MIQATNVLTSHSPYGTKLMTINCTFPRIILAEVNTHRMLSKNSASSRAIPAWKLLKAIADNPFIPVAWQKDHKGMQGTEYFDSGQGDNVHTLVDGWLRARNAAIQIAEGLANNGVTKQIGNRLLEPFMWHTALMSGTEWDNFFDLRCPVYIHGGENFKSREELLTLAIYDDPDVYEVMRYADDLTWRKWNKGQAEIHMMDLAEAIYDVRTDHSKQRMLKEGEWHAPYDTVILSSLNGEKLSTSFGDIVIMDKEALIACSTSIAARTSYTLFGEEKEITYKGLRSIHDKMVVADPFHASPFEHPSRVMYEYEFFNHVKSYMIHKDKVNERLEKEVSQGITKISGYTPDNMVSVTEYGWCRNYRGFIQYRAILEQGLPI